MPFDPEFCFIDGLRAVTVVPLHKEGNVVHYPKPGAYEKSAVKHYPVCAAHKRGFFNGETFDMTNLNNNQENTNMDSINDYVDPDNTAPSQSTDEIGPEDINNNEEDNDMNETRERCGHTTKKGTPCKNWMPCPIKSHQQGELIPLGFTTDDIPDGTVICHSGCIRGARWVGPITNGVPASVTPCRCCLAKGYMTPADVKRDNTFHEIEARNAILADLRSDKPKGALNCSVRDCDKGWHLNLQDAADYHKVKLVVTSSTNVYSKAKVGAPHEFEWQGNSYIAFHKDDKDAAIAYAKTNKLSARFSYKSQQWLIKLS